MTTGISAWWSTTRHQDRRPFLMARSRIKTAIRAWFESQGFVEVDTACLQVSPGNETHLHAFRTQWTSEAGVGEPLYLHTSPEFAMKKLLAAGERRIFTFAPVFRNAERGPLHSPEFTMLEWYRAGEAYTSVMTDCEQLMRIAAETTGHWQWAWRDRSCDVGNACVRTTVADAFRAHAGVDLMASVRGNGVDLDALRAASRAIGLRVADDDTWSDLFSRILGERIEPKLGRGRPEIVAEYPTHEAALARATPHDPRIAERFELYACGVELANGFGELTDANQQRSRFESEMDEKERIYGERYPIDEDFLAALAHMPDASGCAMGFERLVLLASGARHVNDVIWTPVVTPQD